MTQPCTWPVDRGCLPAAETDEDRATQQRAQDMAVSVLWALSGRRYGVCPVIARPCPASCQMPGNDALGPGWLPLWSGGAWRNVRCGCVGVCARSGPGVVHLPGPVAQVEEVRVSDYVLDESAWRVEGDLLYKVEGSWPAQNLGEPLPNAGTWSVLYGRGTPPPPGADVLVGLLTREFLNACSGGKCRLPRRVQTVSRQGITYQMIDPTDIYATGKTGIPEIDLWLAAVNPQHLHSAPSVR